MKNLKNDLGLLNKILVTKVHVQMDRESVVSISVRFDRTKDMVKELSKNIKIDFYNYVIQNLEGNFLDITDLWTLFEDTYNVGAWYNRKENKFYIPNWYQKAIIVYKLKKKEIKFLIKDIKRNLKMVLEV